MTWHRIFEWHEGHVNQVLLISAEIEDRWIYSGPTLRWPATERLVATTVLHALTRFESDAPR